jgi:hypothetical protein
VALVLPQLSVFINGYPVLINQCVPVAACHLISNGNGTIVIIVGLFSAIHAVVKSPSRLQWLQILTNLTVSVIIVLAKLEEAPELTHQFTLLLGEEEVRIRD